MQQNWVLISALLAILAIPFGLAMFEDSTREPEAAGAPELEFEPFRKPEPVGEPIPIDDDDGVVEWERAEWGELEAVTGLLARERPGPGGELARVLELGDLPGSAARRLEARFNAEHSPEAGMTLLGARSSLGPIDGVGFSTPAAPQLRTELRRRWGAPDFSGGRCAVWARPDSPVRAVLDMQASPWRLLLSRYQTLEELLGPGRGRALGLEPTPLVGAEISSLKAEHPDRLLSDGDVSTLMVPPAAGSGQRALAIDLLTRDGVVTELSANIELSCDRTGPSRARALLERGLGPVSRSARIGEATELAFARRPDVSAFIYSDRVVVVRRKR